MSHGITTDTAVFLITVGDTFQPSDSELIPRLQAGDDGAVGDLARGYGAWIQQVALRYLKNAEDAEEVAQDVLLKAVEKIAEFRGDSALSSWLYRITVNTAMSRLRHQRAVLGSKAFVQTLQGDTDEDSRISEIPDWSGLADEAVLRRQMRQRLTFALRRLPVIYRLPVILRDFQGLTTDEASGALGVNGQTLKSRLHRGRLLLRRELSDFAHADTSPWPSHQNGRRHWFPDTNPRARLCST